MGSPISIKPVERLTIAEGACVMVKQVTMAQTVNVTLKINLKKQSIERHFVLLLFGARLCVSLRGRSRCCGRHCSQRSFSIRRSDDCFWAFWRFIFRRFFSCKIEKLLSQKKIIVWLCLTVKFTPSFQRPNQQHIRQHDHQCWKKHHKDCVDVRTPTNIITHWHRVGIRPSETQSQIHACAQKKQLTSPNPPENKTREFACLDKNSLSRNRN